MWKLFFWGYLLLHTMESQKCFAKWFPDLKCHPGAQEDEFQKDGKDRMGINVHRQKADVWCVRVDGDDPCYKHCVFREWGLITREFEWCGRRLFNFFTEITTYSGNMTMGLIKDDFYEHKDMEGYARDKGLSLQKCQSKYEYTDRETGKTMLKIKEPSEKCKSEAYDCMEAVMNCSTTYKDMKI